MSTITRRAAHRARTVLPCLVVLLALAACGDDDGAGPRPLPPPEPLIAFSYEPAGAVAHIAVMKPDGSALRVVTGGAFDDRVPAWRPDGAQLYYSSWRAQRSRIFYAALDDEGTEGTAFVTEEFNPFEVAWSPDARTVAVASTAGLALVTDGVRREIGLRHRYPDDPAWSPDGQWLAYSELAPTSEPGLIRRALFVARADGSEPRRVALGVHSAASNPSWSPDGTRLVFEAGGVGPANDLYVVTIATDAVTRLTETQEGERAPDWSPDGGRIAFSRALNMGDRHIYTMATDGTDVRQLTTGSGTHDSPRWQPRR